MFSYMEKSTNISILKQKRVNTERKGAKKEQNELSHI